MSLEFSCPEGGDFYVCAEGGQFVGCCTADPCGTTGCSAGNLRPAHFPAEQYGTFPDQSCDDGRFYTCGSGFMGCCRSSAVCPNDCSFSDLANIHLSSNEAFAEPFLSLNSTWLAAQTMTSESQTTLATIITTTAGSQATKATTTTETDLSPTSPTPGESTTATAIAPTRDARLNIGAIVGGAVGGLIVLALLVVAVLWLRQHRCRDKFDASAHSTHDPGPEQRCRWSNPLPKIFCVLTLEQQMLANSKLRNRIKKRLERIHKDKSICMDFLSLNHHHSLHRRLSI